MEIRSTRRGDGEGLAGVFLDAARYYAELDPAAFQVPASEGLPEWFEETLQRAVQDENRLELVAEVGGRVVAFLSAHLEEPIATAARQLIRDVGQRRLEID